MDTFLYWPLPALIALLTRSGCLSCDLGSASGFRLLPSAVPSRTSSHPVTGVVRVLDKAVEVVEPAGFEPASPAQCRALVQGLCYGPMWYTRRESNPRLSRSKRDTLVP
jgi:hypothetical protein